MSTTTEATNVFEEPRPHPHLPEDTRPRVAIVGAGRVGSMTALRLAEIDRFSKISLVDIIPDWSAGLALDLWHSAHVRGFSTRLEGSHQFGSLENADYVVVAAGKPRKPGMSRTDLTGVNSEIIRDTGLAIREQAPDAVVIVVTNPLEEMTYLMRKVTGFPRNRVMGMGGVLDTARFCSLVSLTGVATPEDVEAVVLGSHGAEMVIPLSLAHVDGTPLEELLDADVLAQIMQRTRESGAEIGSLLKSSSAFYAPSAAIARMLLDMVTDSPEIVPVCVEAEGHYGLPDITVGLPVRLCRQGISEIVDLKLRAEELDELRSAANLIYVRAQSLLDV
jgi:malate dehydrogenase